MVTFASVVAKSTVEMSNCISQKGERANEMVLKIIKTQSLLSYFCVIGQSK